jgi:hypothetical protein
MRTLCVSLITVALLAGPAVGVAAQSEDESQTGPEATMADVAVGSFDAAGSLAGGRMHHTATTLLDGRVLIIGSTGGYEGEAGDRLAAELWDPATGSFSQTGSLAHPRAWHSATLLSDGLVLVIGGADGNVPAELWDPATGSFSPSAAPTVGRTGHTATLLQDGRVLVAGGFGGRGMIAHAELWDPATGSFTKGGTLQEVRSHHTATLLPDGRVLLIAGDSDLVFRDSAELWDPATDSFAQTGSLADARWWHTTTLLPDGEVLVVGGLGWDEGPAGLVSTELWDPMTGTFSPGTQLFEGRAWHAAALLPGGQVLIVGGVSVTGGDSLDFMPLASAELLDPVSGEVTQTGGLAKARAGHTASLGPDGCVLVVGGGPSPLGAGANLASAEMWCPHR